MNGVTCTIQRVDAVAWLYLLCIPHSRTRNLGVDAVKLAACTGGVMSQGCGAVNLWYYGQVLDLLA